MWRSRLRISALIVLGAALWSALPLFGMAHQGQVTFHGTPVPGATVTAIQGDKKFSTVTDLHGGYRFADLADGTWVIQVEMSGFATSRQDVSVTPGSPAAKWELTLLPLDQIKAQLQNAPPIQAAPPKPAAEAQAEKKPPAEQAQDSDLSDRAADGLLINGSTNNGAASPFAQAAMFGNSRWGGRGLYNGGIGLILGNSALDARPFSITGQDTPKPAYSRMTGILTLGGPIRIPHLVRRGPYFFFGYQWTRNNNAVSQPGLMPDASLRAGQFPSSIVDPLSGAPFPNNTVPQTRMSPQALALLKLYPFPNLAGATRYNYQIPIVSPTHQDALQTRWNKGIGNKDELSGRFAFQSTRTDGPNLFGFLDTTNILGIDTSVSWWHRFNRQWFVDLGYEFSRQTTRTKPYFANRENISGQAGIAGNNQDPRNWGPPGLTFSSGITGLSDSQSTFDRNQTGALSFAVSWYHGQHNIKFGGDYRRQQFNYLSQQNPRGSLTFTGAVTGSDFADYLLGIPDTSAIAYGNADKYLRESVYDLFATDDWRISPELSLNFGVRWEYGAPITELFNRLVNLDIGSGFTAVAPVLASNPTGALTGQHYPNSLVRPDKTAVEPRVALAWRPISGASWVFRAGYGVYYDTSVYQTIASQMAQQPPLSKTLSVQNSPEHPLTLANPFSLPPSATGNTFAIDPNFHVGYVHTWQASAQRDLPGSLQLTVSYLGIKGTHAVQEFLPNTYPIGAATPCPACPAGFAYLTSNANSSLESGRIQLRRRLHNGVTATLQYAYSKAIDDAAALGGQGANVPGTGTGKASPPATPLIAQNWLNLRGERGLSSFDQRHLVTLVMQYTSGMGARGGTLLGGWGGRLLKEWTVNTEITAGSGLPETPIYLVPTPGTGVTGSIRPNYTGAPLYASPAGSFLNPAAYAAPPSGQWGNAGRGSITGPGQFGLNASLGRTFRLNDRFNLDVRADATNVINRVNFSSWNTIINNAQFGFPVAANAMRSIQITMRVRF